MSINTQTTATAQRAGAVPEGPHGPGSAYPLEDGSAPDDSFRIKGNVNSGLYHGEESRGYAETKAEVWFSSEEAAEAAGFKAWDWRSRARKARQAARAAARPVPAARPAPEPVATEAPAATEAATETGGAEAVPEGPHGPGSAHPLEDASSPHARFHVKGNADSGLYHTTDSPHYGRTKAEVWFASNEHPVATEAPAATEAATETGGAEAVPEGPHGPGSAHPLEDASSPHARFHVKGNADSGLYHTTDSPHYGRTKAEVWFASNEHAEAAGFKHWKRHKAE